MALCGSLVLWARVNIETFGKSKAVESRFLFRAVDDDGRPSAVTKPLAALPEQLRYRASRLRQQANFFLVTLMVVIAGGVAIYVQAGQLSLTTTDKALTGLERSISDAASASGGANALEACKAQRTEVFGRNGVPQQDQCERALSAIKKQIANMLPTIEKAQADLREVAKGPNEHESLRLQFYGTLATRVGAILMLVFLAQFLINAYRYTTRVAAVYDARADAVGLMWDAPEQQRWIDAEAARKFTSVDELSFDKVKSPSAEALEIAKQLLREVKGGSKD